MDAVHGFGFAALAFDRHDAKKRFGQALLTRMKNHGFLQVFLIEHESTAAVGSEESCLHCVRTAAFAHTCCCKASPYIDSNKVLWD